ncbi:hypothetical protein B0H11DRAFT_1901168 [Mycena galericulata]|nr:hypothetical protein B0H11DRAFT_1901168 [Mycena galericulata]
MREKNAFRVHHSLGNGDARRRIVKKTNFASYIKEAFNEKMLAEKNRKNITQLLPGAEPPIQLRLEKIAGCASGLGRVVGMVAVRGREVSCRQYDPVGAGPPLPRPAHSQNGKVPPLGQRRHIALNVPPLISMCLLLNGLEKWQGALEAALETARI